MWVLDYLDDIDSDMSAFHRVDDARTMLPAPLYFARAERLPAYDGVMRARVQAEMRRGGGTSATPGHVTVPDTIALDRLANEGWLDYNAGGNAT